MDGHRHKNGMIFNQFWGRVLGEFWGEVFLLKKTGTLRLPLSSNPKN